jgi:hypothetical protein
VCGCREGVEKESLDIEGESKKEKMMKIYVNIYI